MHTYAHVAHIRDNALSHTNAGNILKKKDREKENTKSLQILENVKNLAT